MNTKPLTPVGEAKIDQRRNRHLLNRARRYLDAGNIKMWKKLVVSNQDNAELGASLQSVLQESIRAEVNK